MRPIAIRLDGRTRAGLELLARVTGRSCADHAAHALGVYVREQLEVLVAQGILKTEDPPGEEASGPGRRDLLV